MLQGKDSKLPALLSTFSLLVEVLSMKSALIELYPFSNPVILLERRPPSCVRWLPRLLLQAYQKSGLGTAILRSNFVNSCITAVEVVTLEGGQARCLKTLFDLYNPFGRASFSRTCSKLESTKPSLLPGGYARYRPEPGA